MNAATSYRVIFIDGLTKREHSNSVRYPSAVAAHNDALDTISNVKSAYPEALIDYRVKAIR